MENHLQEERLIAIDIETTGLDKEKDCIIEIAAVEILKRKIGNSKVFRVKPKIKVSNDSFKIHGISNKDLEDCPAFAEIAPKLLDFISDDNLIMHNADFDASFINKELKESGFTDFSSKKIVDTMVLARAKFYRKNSLKDLVEKLEIKKKHIAHNALSDAEITALIFLKLVPWEGTLDFFDFFSYISQKDKKYTPKIIFPTSIEIAEHRKFLDNFISNHIWKE